MKKHLIVVLFIGLLFSCSSNDDKAAAAPALPLTEQTLANVAYGTDRQQKMDVYLPANRTTDTKVVIVIHGGAWVEGDKADMAGVAAIVHERFPDYAVVNINYRLATQSSPAFPKQTEDLRKVINFLKDSNYTISDDYALVGASAGAHIAMLYSYNYDTASDVKVVCNIVGPADFSDPAYVTHPLYSFAAQALLGTPNVTEQMIADVSPINHITAQSPPTITFYGGVDPLIPSSQGPRLEAALDAAGVYNEFYFYPEGGHADWDQATFDDVYARFTAFFNAKFR
jgi:acetyl esterase/lipase